MKFDQVHFTVQDHSQRISSMEVVSDELSQCVSELENMCSSLRENTKLIDKVTDLEGRSRRKNQRILNLVYGSWLSYRVLFRSATWGFWQRDTSIPAGDWQSSPLCGSQAEGRTVAISSHHLPASLPGKGVAYPWSLLEREAGVPWTTYLSGGRLLSWSS